MDTCIQSVLMPVSLLIYVLLKISVHLLCERQHLLLCWHIYSKIIPLILIRLANSRIYTCPVVWYIPTILQYYTQAATCAIVSLFFSIGAVTSNRIGKKSTLVRSSSCIWYTPPPSGYHLARLPSWYHLRGRRREDGIKIHVLSFHFFLWTIYLRCWLTETYSSA
jgi:hypothetical protein